MNGHMGASRTAAAYPLMSSSYSCPRVFEGVIALGENFLGVSPRIPLDGPAGLVELRPLDSRSVREDTIV